MHVHAGITRFSWATAKKLIDETGVVGAVSI